MQRDGGNDGVDTFLRLLSPPGNKMEAAKRLAPAAGTFEFCGECQRVSALIEDGRANMVKSLMMVLTDDDRQEIWHVILSRYWSDGQAAKVVRGAAGRLGVFKEAACCFVRSKQAQTLRPCSILEGINDLRRRQATIACQQQPFG
jgi:hypothetical protein